MSSPGSEVTYSRFRWFVLVTMFVVIGTTAVGLISPAPLIPKIFASFLPDPSMAGAILGNKVALPAGAMNIGQIANVAMLYFNLAVAIGALSGGWFIDRFGALPIFYWGAVLVGVGWLLMPSVGSTIGGVVVLRVVQGLGTGPVMASAAAVAAVRFPVHERGIVTATQGAAMAAGVGLGQAFMGDVYKAVGGTWQDAVFVLWPLALVAVLMTTIVAFGPKPVVVKREDLTAADVAAQKHALRAALRHPVTWAAIACVFILSWVYQAFNDLSPTYLTDPNIGVGFTNGGKMLLAAQVLNFIGAFAGGVFTERAMRGRVRPSLVLGFSVGAVAGISMLMPFAVHNAAVMTVVVCIAGFFFAWVNPNALAFFAKTYPSNIVGKLGGYAMGLGIFGGSAGVAAGAHALGATNHFTLSIIIMSTVCAFGVVPALFLRQGRSAHLPADTTVGRDASMATAV